MLQEESTSTALAREAATLNYLRDKSDLPVTKVFSFWIVPVLLSFPLSFSNLELPSSIALKLNTFIVFSSDLAARSQIARDSPSSLGIRLVVRNVRNSSCS